MNIVFPEENIFKKNPKIISQCACVPMDSEWIGICVCMKVHTMRCEVSNVWCLVCGVWCVMCGVWCVVCGMWYTVVAVWCLMVCGVA